ncbi:MAG: restriction endonuclease subunit S, partial [Pseudomonadota bacterium]
ISQVKIALPSNTEQEKAVVFLDSETSKLQQIIDLKHNQIELLREHEKSLIHNAVTKGLDPKAKMKDSGVEWIGNIPESWKLKRIKEVSYVKGRIGWQGLTTEEYKDAGPFLVTGTDFSNGSINWDSCYHVDEERWAEDPYIQLKNGDLLITKDGTIGKIAVVKNLVSKATLNSGIFVVRSTTKENNPDYLYWILNSTIFTEWIDYIKTGSTINHLYQEKFVDFRFPNPPHEIQIVISTYLNKEIAKLHQAINTIETQITKLEEYQKSLIYEVVTGKVKVS